MKCYSQGKYSGNIEKIHFINGIILGSTLYKCDQRSSMHYHVNPHISFLLNGIHYEKRKGSEFTMIPGDILFCHSGEAHQFITGRNSRNINIELDVKVIQQLNISESRIRSSVLSSFDAKFIMLKMFQELILEDDYSYPSVQILLLSLIGESSRIKEKDHPLWTRRLIEILNDRWNDHLSLTELSILIEKHPVTISKYFTKYFGCSFGDYRRKLKVSKSLGLIKTSSLSLTEIAYSCGFADQSHFIRTFKSYTSYRKTSVSCRQTILEPG